MFFSHTKSALATNQPLILLFYNKLAITTSHSPAEVPNRADRLTMQPPPTLSNSHWGRFQAFALNLNIVAGSGT